MNVRTSPIRFWKLIGEGEFVEFYVHEAGAVFEVFVSVLVPAVVFVVVDVDVVVVEVLVGDTLFVEL